MMVVLEKCKYVEKYYNVLENILSLKVTNAMLQPRYVSIQNLDPCKHQQNTLIHLKNLEAKFKQEVKGVFVLRHSHQCDC